MESIGILLITSNMSNITAHILSISGDTSLYWYGTVRLHETIRSHLLLDHYIPSEDGDMGYPVFTYWSLGMDQCLLSHFADYFLQKF
jgi:hypothetical protein